VEKEGKGANKLSLPALTDRQSSSRASGRLRWLALAEPAPSSSPLVSVNLVPASPPPLLGFPCRRR
jgi:hypothetical protein